MVKGIKDLGKPETAASEIRDALRACRQHASLAALFSAGVNLLYLAPSLYMMQVYDRVLSSYSIDTLIFLSLMLGLSLLVFGILDWTRARVLIRMGLRFDKQLSRRLLRLLAKPGTLLSADEREALRDLDVLRQYSSGVGAHLLFDAPWAPLYLGIATLLHPLFGLATLIGMVVLAGLAIWNERAIHGRLDQAAAASRRSYRLTDALMRDGETIQAMGMAEAVIDRIEESRRQLLGLQSHASAESAGFTSAGRAIRIALQSLTLGLGAFLVMKGEVSGGIMFVSSLITSRALAPIEQAAGSWKQSLGAIDSYKRLARILRAAPAMGPVTQLPAPTGAILLERVVLQMPGQDVPIVGRVDLAVQPGETLGLIGPSAAGKSTLLKLALGIIAPTDGTVRMDGADVARWPREDLGRAIGYLPQQVDFLTGTVRDVIARFGDGSDESVIAAAQAADVHEMILRLPKGYDTMLGDGGLPLSGGQRQRIGLARALYGNPAIVALDEPYSNLDSDGETALMRVLVALKQRGTTVLVVTHRPNTLATADRIAVVRGGRIELIGPRTDVLARLSGASVVPMNRAEKAAP